MKKKLFFVSILLTATIILYFGNLSSSTIKENDALYKALKNNNKPEILTILESTNINKKRLKHFKQDPKINCIHIAAYMKHSRLIPLLMQTYNLTINDLDSHNNTPLDLCSFASLESPYEQSEHEKIKKNIAFLIKLNAQWNNLKKAFFNIRINEEDRHILFSLFLCNAPFVDNYNYLSSFLTKKFTYNSYISNLGISFHNYLHDYHVNSAEKIHNFFNYLHTIIHKDNFYDYHLSMALKKILFSTKPNQDSLHCLLIKAIKSQLPYSSNKKVLIQKALNILNDSSLIWNSSWEEIQCWHLIKSVKNYMLNKFLPYYKTPKHNITPLMLAAARNKQQIVKEVLNLKNSDQKLFINAHENAEEGITALSLAYNNGNTEIAFMLYKYLAPERAKQRRLLEKIFKKNIPTDINENIAQYIHGSRPEKLV